MNDELTNQIQELPNQPGVYLMHSQKGDIIYVGKARSLKKRVRSYFSGSKDIKTRMLVSRIHSIEYIVTSNEYEALLLENTLIKKWNPRYNINLKDGKTYPVIRITNEDFPQVFRTRRIIQDGSEYFGPYPQVGMLNIYLEIIKKLYPIRLCRGRLKKRESPCLYHHIGLCSGPCAGKVTKKEYRKYINKIRDLLSGDAGTLVRKLTREMNAAVKELQFERAAKIRDYIISIEEVGQQQDVVDFSEEQQRDYIVCVPKENLATFAVMRFQGGRLSARDLYRSEIYSTPEEGLSEFLMQYYSDDNLPPPRLFVDPPVESGELTAWWKKQFEQTVDVSSPDQGKHFSILRMARENASLDVERRFKKRVNTDALEDLATALNLKALPKRIEGFDIAQLDGKYPVSSLISFKDGLPDRKNYRYFRLKTLDGKVDDYEAIREAVARRYTRILNEDLPRPDLIMIDGGKGQVNAARSILDALGFQETPVVGLAKKEELIFFPDRDEPLDLPESSSGLKLLQAVRDETHRFATSLNKRLRARDSRASLLEGIPGIGPKRSRQILQAVSSLDELIQLSPSDLAVRAEIPEQVAREVIKEISAAEVFNGKEVSRRDEDL